MKGYNKFINDIALMHPMAILFWVIASMIFESNLADFISTYAGEVFDGISITYLFWFGWVTIVAQYVELKSELKANRTLDIVEYCYLYLLFFNLIMTPGLRYFDIIPTEGQDGILRWIEVALVISFFSAMIMLTWNTAKMLIASTKGSKGTLKFQLKVSIQLFMFPIFIFHLHNRLKQLSINKD